jgi:hypothetical protein
MRALRLDLEPPEARALAAALLLSGENPSVSVLIRHLVEETELPELSVWWAVLLLESKGLVQSSRPTASVRVTGEACDWYGALQLSQTAHGAARQ